MFKLVRIVLWILARIAFHFTKCSEMKECEAEMVKSAVSVSDLRTCELSHERDQPEQGESWSCYNINFNQNQSTFLSSLFCPADDLTYTTLLHTHQLINSNHQVHINHLSCLIHKSISQFS